MVSEAGGSHGEKTNKHDIVFVNSRSQTRVDALDF